MKISFLFILIALLSNDPKEIIKINSLKKEAEEAFLNGNYELAVSKYILLSDSMGVDDDLIKLNLGHAYYHLGDTSGAKLNYGRVGAARSKKLRSIAYQQLGVMSKDAGKLEESLQQLKSAVKADPTNKDAVYDYEVVKKLLEEKKKQEQQNQDNKDQDQQDQDQQDQDQDQNEEKNEKQNQDKQDQDQKQDGEQEQKDQERENQEQSEQEKEEEQQKEQKQENGEEEEQQQEKSQEQITKEKLEEMGISEEKARQLLEAMKQSEIKYLQNQKRKATKRPASGKPDW
ncbi:MAG: hypothetical protein AAGI25_14655 [Bacteroidota bacterium]